MSDERLRELERRWKESGSVEDEGAYLLERVRATHLSQERLELAAYCGHEGARMALGECAPNAPADLQEWLQPLESSSESIRLEILEACIGALDSGPVRGLNPKPKRLESFAVKLLRELTAHPLGELHEFVSNTGALQAVALICARADAQIPMSAVSAGPVWPEAPSQAKANVLARIKAAVVTEFLRNSS